MTELTQSFDWRSLYASDVFNWQRLSTEDKLLYYRRLGVVENLFDLDGIDWEGRADLNIKINVEVKTPLDDNALRRRLMLIWSCVRALYPLLSSKSLYRSEFLPGELGRRWIDKCFVYEHLATREQMLENARQHATFVQDSYTDVDTDDFYLHLLNTGRAFKEKDTLSRLLVLPWKKNAAGHLKLTFIVVVGHEAVDGLTVFRLTNTFLDLLNTTEQDLLNRLDDLCPPQNDILARLPPAQETLYPTYAKTTAKDRWNWAITRILRHIRHPPPAAFQNPLLRDTPLKTASRMLCEKFAHVLDYTKTPPLNASWVVATLSALATRNLSKLCKEARISIGSGAFTLVGMTMMRLQEVRQPDTTQHKRLPFVGSFPVNPRPFLTGPPTTGKEASLMLAFSDGVTLPFITSDLDFCKTFRVLGRLAHHQLRQYQKRKRSAEEEASLGSRSPRQLLPTLFLSSMERLEGKAQPEQRVGLFPQATYPARSSPTLATCGISSVGYVGNVIETEKYDLNKEITGPSDLIAVFRDVKSIVRPRDGEFLCGTIGTKENMQFRVSCDGSAIDPERAQVWRELIERVLDCDMEETSPTMMSSSAGVSGVPGGRSKL